MTRNVAGVALLAASALAAATSPGPAPAEPWAIGPFTKKHAVNPILEPSPEPRFACPIQGREVSWEALASYNAAAVVRGGQAFLLYRAQDADGGRGWGSRAAGDGLAFTRRKAPVHYPDHDVMKDYEGPGGCEDPRLVSDGKGDTS